MRLSRFRQTLEFGHFTTLMKSFLESGYSPRSVWGPTLFSLRVWIFTSVSILQLTCSSRPRWF